MLIPTYWQRVLRLPPEAAGAGRTLLMHDFHDQFATALFFGREARLFVFEALMFCAVDSAVAGAPGGASVAGLVVLAAWLALRAVRLHFGETNLSKKTLVDRHFLI